MQAEDEAAGERALQEAERRLTEVPKAEPGTVRETPPSSIRMALDATPDASLALISTPGEYAASEALKALDLGLDVMVFSDNVSLDDEVMLKRRAHERGLLVMGPDCGTAIVDGLPLGFANVVWRGDIGCVGAAGTGLQQVTTLIDRWGAGITHALGTGSHDLSAEVGGITYLDAIAALDADPETRILLLVSKPPSPEVARAGARRRHRDPQARGRVLPRRGPRGVERPGVRAAVTLEDAAALAVELSHGRGAEARRRQRDCGQEIEQAARGTRARAALHPRALQRRHLRLRGVAAAVRASRQRCGPTRRRGRSSGSTTRGRASGTRSSTSATTCSRADGRTR